jgi:hypothetical protein
MLKRHSDGQELGELVNTARNTYVNTGNVAQFDFHQSDKSNVSLSWLSFLSSNDLMESVQFHRTGVSIKDYKWQDTTPGEQKVNQLFNTNCNKWYFNRLVKHVHQSIIQLYLQKVTLLVKPYMSSEEQNPRVSCEISRVSCEISRLQNGIRGTRSKSSEDVLSGIVMAVTLSETGYCRWLGPLLGWVTESVILSSPVVRTPGFRELVPVARRTTTLLSSCWERIKFRERVCHLMKGVIMSTVQNHTVCI